MALNRTFTLNNGIKIPAVGFGTLKSKSPWRSLFVLDIDTDCTAIYRNKVEVGEGIRASGVERQDIFVSFVSVICSITFFYDRSKIAAVI